MPEIVFCCACGRLIPQADIESKAAIRASNGLLCRNCSEAAVAPTGKMIRPAARGSRRYGTGKAGAATSRAAAGPARGTGSGNGAAASTTAILPARPRSVEAKLAICAAVAVIGALCVALLWPPADRNGRPRKTDEPARAPQSAPKPAIVRSSTAHPDPEPFRAPKVRLPLNDPGWEAEAAEALRKADGFAGKNPTRLEEALELYEAVRRDYPGSRAELDAETRILKLKAAIGIRRDAAAEAARKTPDPAAPAPESPRESEAPPKGPADRKTPGAD
ncbi:MAG: hypothetical protein N3A38_06050 [Planctomycetota bacterium]|nr:hypothetical protein [Planctomycetota bacterium]